MIFCFWGLFLAFAPKDTGVTGLNGWLGWPFSARLSCACSCIFPKMATFLAQNRAFPLHSYPRGFWHSVPAKPRAIPRRAVQNARTKRPVLAQVYPAQPMPRKTRNQLNRKVPWVRIPPAPPSKSQ